MLPLPVVNAFVKFAFGVQVALEISETVPVGATGDPVAFNATALTTADKLMHAINIDKSRNCFILNPLLKSNRKTANTLERSINYYIPPFNHNLTLLFHHSQK